LQSTHLHLFIGWEHIGHLSSVQHVVDVLNKRLVLYLAVRKQEHDALAVTTSASQEALEVVPPVSTAVILADLDLQQHMRTYINTENFCM
jgi:hypothetical protein